MLALGTGPALEATASGFFEETGGVANVTLNIADVNASTGKTGSRSWTLSFSGKK
jgi:hypothetical protein